MNNFRLFLLLLLSYPFLASAQADHPELRQTFAQYFQLLEKRDNAAVLDHIYPKLFEHYPRPLLETATKKVDDDTSTVITMDSSQILRIAPVLILENVQYTRVDYSYRMHILIREDTDTDKDDDGEEDFQFGDTLAEFMYAILKGQYGEKNITLDAEKNRLDILVNAQLYAILDPAYEGWKFLEKKDNLQEVLEKLLPAKVLKKL